MTGPYPPPQQPWQNDGSWQQPQPGQQPGPPPQDPTPSSSYDLYPQTGGWPDQNQAPPPQAPAYGPPPGPPVYGPTSAPPYGPTSAPPYGPPGQFMPAGPPMAPQNNNKGWIFGGIAVAAVVVLLVIGFVVVNALSSDDSNNNAGSDGSNSTGEDDTSTAAKYKEVSDLCALVSESAYSDVLSPSGSGTPSNSDYGSGPSMGCIQDLEGNDYDLGTLSTNATLFDDTSQMDSTFDSYLSVYETGGVSAEDVSGLGERAKIVFDDAIIPSAYLIVQDGNLIADVRLSTTEDAIGNAKLQTAAEAVMKEMLAGLAAG